MTEIRNDALKEIEAELTVIAKTIGDSKRIPITQVSPCGCETPCTWSEEGQEYIGDRILQLTIPLDKLTRLRVQLGDILDAIGETMRMIEDGNYSDEYTPLDAARGVGSGIEDAIETLDSITLSSPASPKQMKGKVILTLDEDGLKLWL